MIELEMAEVIAQWMNSQEIWGEEWRLRFAAYAQHPEFPEVDEEYLELAYQQYCEGAACYEPMEGEGEHWLRLIRRWPGRYRALERIAGVMAEEEYPWAA